MKTAIKKLAESMGVTVTDVMCLARSVVNDLERDKTVETFKNSNRKDRAEIVTAYVAHANRKMQEFVSVYKTRDGADRALQSSVFELIRNPATN